MAKVKAIGQMNRRLQAEKLVKTPDDAGGYAEAWEVVYTTWASVGPVTSMRELQALQNVQTNSYQVQMRYTPSHEVSKDIRFIYEGQILIINRMEQITEGRKRFWSLVLTEQL